MRFLHAADVHLDAQLRIKGAAASNDRRDDLLRQATRRAFANLVDLALGEGVDFVVIAGDLFDREFSETHTWVWAREQFRRLERADVPVYLIRGNHDSLADARGAQRLTWPANVHEFPADRPGTMRIERLGVALHGQSFPTRSVPDDLAAHYPDAVAGAFNIGLLHTSLNGSADHDPYAPADPNDLKLKGYDYWALGHIHAHQRVMEEPAIVYPGCTQGRTIRETGPKGCVLVTVDGPAEWQVEFRPLDVVRWAHRSVESQPDDDWSRLLDRAGEALRQARHEAEDRPVVVRLLVRGPCACHDRLHSDRGLEEFRAELELRGEDLGDVWIERVDVRVHRPIDLQQIRTEPGPLGELLRDVRKLSENAESELAELAAEALRPLQARAGRELAAAGLEPADPALLRSWLEQSEGLIVDALAEAEAAT